MIGGRADEGSPLSKTIVIYGASGHGKVVADIAYLSGLEVVGFVDDDTSKIGIIHFGSRVLSWDDVLHRYGGGPALLVALGIGDNACREACHERLVAAGLALPALVHPSAVVAASGSLGRGTVVMANAAVNPDATVGEGCILNTGSVVEHDNRLGRFVHLSPNAALGGGVTIGDRTHVGLGAVVLPGVTIGDDVRVGAGAVVHRSVPAGSTVVGIPARPITPRV